MELCARRTTRKQAQQNRILKTSRDVHRALCGVLFARTARRELRQEQGGRCARFYQQRKEGILMRMKMLKALTAVAREIQRILDAHLPLDAMYGLRTR